MFHTLCDADHDADAEILHRVTSESLVPRAFHGYVGDTRYPAASCVMSRCLRAPSWVCRRVSATASNCLMEMPANNRYRPEHDIPKFEYLDYGVASLAVGVRPEWPVRYAFALRRCHWQSHRIEAGIALDDLFHFLMHHGIELGLEHGLAEPHVFHKFGSDLLPNYVFIVWRLKNRVWCKSCSFPGSSNQSVQKYGCYR